jgi:hypothetical protein
MSSIASAVLPVCLVNVETKLTDRQLQLPPGLPDLPLVRRWHRLGLRRAAARAPVDRLRQEVEARVLRVPGPPRLDVRG